MSTEPTETVAWGAPAPSSPEPQAPAVAESARRRYWQAPAVLAVFLLIAGAAAGAGIALSGDDASGASTVGAPENETCRTYDMRGVYAATNDSPVVPCDESHSAQTFAVVDALPDPGDQGRWTEQQIQDAATKPCSFDAAARALAIEPAELAVTRLDIAFFTPTAEQADEGARWVRCDLFLRNGGRTAVVAGDFRELIDIDGAFTQCAARSSGLFVGNPADCSDSADQEAAIGGIDLGAFGSRIDVQDLRSQCADLADDASDAANPAWRVTLPSTAAWQAGNGFAACWLRADQWDVDRGDWPSEQPVGATVDERGVPNDDTLSV